MENISENIGKPRRGRPRVIPAFEENSLRSLGVIDASKTRRTHLNVYYRQRAVRFILTHKRHLTFRWLADEKAIERGDKDAWRPVILSELGRIQDDGELEAAARQICKLKPTTREAILMIREYRTGKKPAGNTLTLADAVINTLNDYQQSHSGITRAEMRQALLTAMEAVGESD